MTRRGASIKDAEAHKWLGRIGSVSRTGETATLIARVSSFKVLCDGLVVTNMRVYAAMIKDLPKRGPKVALELGDVTKISAPSKASGRFLVLTDRTGNEHSFGRFAYDSDIDLVCQHLSAVAPWATLVVEPVGQTTSSSFLGTATVTNDGPGTRQKTESENSGSTQAPPPRTEQPVEPPEGFVVYGSQPPPESRPAFDASRPPKPGDPVPADCVWAIRQHPGPMPGRATFGNHAKRMRVMGDPTARTEAEIISALGRPQSRGVIGTDGSYLLQWQHNSNWSYNTHFALQFDRYGVCAGITHNWQAL